MNNAKQRMTSGLVLDIQAECVFWTITDDISFKNDE